MRYDAQSGITIMLVDANEKFLQHLMNFLKKNLPYNVICEKNGTNALLTAEKKPVHLFLMEAKLTKQVSGFETLELIKNDERFSKIPVIFISSLRDPVSVNRAKSLDVDAYLYKPIDKRQVFDYVVKYINKNVKFNVLYVDSDNSLFPRVKNIIEQLFPYKVEVFTAESALEGMEIINSQEINLLICGNDMPIISGVRMLSMLKEQEKLNEMGVIFVPNELDMAERYALAELEIEHYAEKPFENPNEFIETIMSALNISPISEHNSLILD